MIKINLATKKQSSSLTGELRSAAGGDGLKRFTKISFDSESIAPLRKLVLAFVVVFLANFVLEDYKKTELQIMDQKVTKLSQKQSDLQKKLAQTQDYQKVKEQFETDEFALKTKIETIEKLVQGRKDSIHSLVTLSQAIPEQAWLTEFGIQSGQIKINGVASDYSLISDFMQKLGDSEFFRNITLKNTSQALDEINVAQFELQATTQ